MPIGDAAPQALRGLRGGWRSPRRRLRAHGPGRAGVGLHPELQNRVRLLPVAQPQTYLQKSRRYEYCMILLAKKLARRYVRCAPNSGVAWGF